GPVDLHLIMSIDGPAGSRQKPPAPSADRNGMISAKLSAVPTLQPPLPRQLLRRLPPQCPLRQRLLGTQSSRRRCRRSTRTNLPAKRACTLALTNTMRTRQNRPGASTNISAQAVINSPPDGYTLLFYSASTLINSSMFSNLPFDVRRDIAPVSGLVVYPMMLVAHPSVPAKTVTELIVHAKANPGKVTMASFGTGSASHLAGELFKMMAGINLVHVPYRGGAPMVTDLIAGQVQVGFDVMVTSLPHVRTGALRALGVAGSNRFDMLPDVPTIAETVPGYEARTWAGVGVPKGTPAEIIARLNHEINAGLAEPTIKSRLAELGTIPMIFTAAEFGAYVAAESEKWEKVIQFAGIKPE